MFRKPPGSQGSSFIKGILVLLVEHPPPFPCSSLCSGCKLLSSALLMGDINSDSSRDHEEGWISQESEAFTLCMREKQPIPACASWSASPALQPSKCYHLGTGWVAYLPYSQILVTLHASQWAQSASSLQLKKPDFSLRKISSHSFSVIHPDQI